MGLLDSIFSALGLRKQAEVAPEASSAAQDPIQEPAESDAAPEPDPGDRDLELEAHDDVASFDFKGDIARYFTAEFKAEQVWSDPRRRAVLFSEYGVRDTQHWYQVKATFERWCESPEAKAKYPHEKDLRVARMTTTQTISIEDLNLPD